MKKNCNMYNDYICAQALICYNCKLYSRMCDRIRNTFDLFLVQLSITINQVCLSFDVLWFNMICLC